MTLDLNNTLANALLDRYDTEFPAGSLLKLRTGAPAGAENAAGGTLLGTITTPASPWAAASAGSKAKSGTWSSSGVAGGTAGNFRLENAANTKLEEGTVTASGGGGDLTLDNVVIANGQAFSMTQYTRTL
jgi:hypothetical protein